MAGLPPVDQEVTQEELVRLVERLGHDPARVAGLTIAPAQIGSEPVDGKVLRVTVRYVQLVRPMEGKSK